MAARTATQAGPWNVIATWGGASVPVSGDDVDVATFAITLPADYAAACQSLTGGVGGSVTGAEGSSLTLDDTVSIDMSIETLTMVGTAAKPCTIQSAASGEPTNKLPANMTNLVVTYTSVLDMATPLKASVLTMTDSEYWFYVTTEPEEHILLATWTGTRSMVASYDGKKWYLKVTSGSISWTAGLFVNLLPTFYSATHYIVFFQPGWEMTKVPAQKMFAESGFLGGTGEYSENTGFLSAKVIGQGRVAYGDLSDWNHVLDHRIFTAALEVLYADDNDFPNFTWPSGHFSKAELTEFNPIVEPGEADVVSSRIWRIVVKERPYN